MQSKIDFLLKWLKRILLFFFISSIVSTILFRFIPIPCTPLMLIRCWEQWREGRSIKMAKEWTSYEEFTPHIPRAIMASEDQLYMDHYGFDFKAIEEAYEQNKTSKSKRGASTISQQVAKNVFLWPSRNFIRKGLEVYFTMLIEVLWDKKRILEVYMNVAETGEGIYGFQAASKYYYKKPANKISRSQAAMLAAILPNPRKYSPVKPAEHTVRKQEWILKNMNQMGKVDL